MTEYDDDYSPGCDDDDGPDSGWCSECGKECGVQVLDYGIGGYDYWGARGNDIQMCAVSDCCEGEVLESEPEPEEPPGDTEGDGAV